MRKVNILVLSAIAGGLVFSACSRNAPEATPTRSVELIQTFAVATFASGLTQTAISMPTNTPTSTNTPFPTPTLGTPIVLGTFTPGGVNPTASCYAMTFVRDVTIPDNAPMAPGQTFTKIWRVRNSGSCPWEVGFKFAFTGGDPLGGTTLTLSQAIAAGAETELSVAMTAPTNKTGSICSNWRMSTAAGAFFGDEVYVIINVGSSATATATSSGSSTATPSPTATPTPTTTIAPTS